MEWAFQDAIVEVTIAAVGPSHAPVMGFALFGGFVASGEGASAVAGGLGLFLGLGEQALFVAVIQR